jgi:protein SCO1/2
MSDVPRSGQQSRWPVLVGLAVVVLALVAVFVYAGLKPRGAAEKPLPVYGQIADFTLTNQDGRAVSLAELRGKVWVADIIFTRCAGPCPMMTRRMKELQDALPATSQAKLVTLTTDPEFDTPPVLKTYTERFGADTNRWMFLTGTKPQIGKLAVDSLKLSAVEKKPDERESPEDLFVHSTIFVVVDSQARLRGIFQSVGPDIDPKEQMEKILAAVERLEREE